MNEIISRELLSEVLKEKVIKVYKVSKCSLAYETFTTDIAIPVVNNHELLHICKEWALLEYGFTITSFLFRGDNYPIGEYDGASVIFFPDNETPSIRFDEGTEYQSVFEACQWILDNEK